MDWGFDLHWKFREGNATPNLPLLWWSARVGLHDGVRAQVMRAVLTARQEIIAIVNMGLYVHPH